MNYSFVDARRGAETPEGVSYTYMLSGPALEAIVDWMIDPYLAMIPQAGDPVSAYPPDCEENQQRREFWEQFVLDGKAPLAPLYLLPESSKLRAEWFRRAEILKWEREQMKRD